MSLPVLEYRLAEARKASERGWPLVQLDGKVPLHKEWQKAPMPPISAAEAWAMAGNIGLRTGSVSGVVVLDDDTEDGSGVAGLDLPRTVTVETGSGKRHYYFKCPAGGLRNSPGNLPSKVDVRGDGGQVVYVGSIHPETGRPYLWVPGLSPDDVVLAELPQHVLDLIQGRGQAAGECKKSVKGRRPVAIDQSARLALDEAASAIAAAPEGARNQTLNDEAFRMARWVDSGLLPRVEVEAALGDAARVAGLADAEIPRTLKSGLDAGLQEPRRLRQADESPGTAMAHPLPSIVLEGGALPAIVAQAEVALLQANARLFQRGHLVVRPMRAPAMTLRDVYRRAEGALVICPVDAPYLVEFLTMVASWYRPTRDDLVLVDCPEKVARTYLARSGHWRLPYLLGVIETPTLRPDGSILDLPGYDPATCLLFDPGGVEFPPIPEHPTRKDALQALGRLERVIKDFPWLEASDHSAALAAILTALIRHSLRTAPLFAFRSPKMSSGKSLLADVVAMISTGRVASVMSQGKDEDEDKKRMLAILMEGVSVACIDNIDREFGGAVLCSVLTQESWRERILGRSGTATVPTTTTWLATGNNLRLVGDIITRVVLCDLDPRIERPEERVFDVNLHHYVPQHRGELVVAGLSILRAYHFAGRPDQHLPVFGRFEEWSDWVRSALVWAGLADPCEGRARLHQHDPVGSQLRAVVQAWHEELAGPHTAAQAIQSVARNDGGSTSSLYEAFLAVAMGTGGKPDARRLGNYLAKYERRVEAGLRIERVGERQGVALWRVTEVDSSQPPASDGPLSGGFVGFVGPFPPAQGARALSRGEAGSGASNDERSASAENDPRNPRNPRGLAAVPNQGARAGHEQPRDPLTEQVVDLFDGTVVSLFERSDADSLL